MRSKHHLHYNIFHQTKSQIIVPAIMHTNVTIYLTSINNVSTDIGFFDYDNDVYCVSTTVHLVLNYNKKIVLAITLRGIITHSNPFVMHVLMEH